MAMVSSFLQNSPWSLFYNPCLFAPPSPSRFSLHLLSPRAAIAGTHYSRIAADPGRLPHSRESIDSLQDVLQSAATRGAEVVMAAIDKPRNIDYKGKSDLVTDTDKRCELAILEVVNAKCPDHLILGEEGGVSGDPSSPFLWCIDPLVSGAYHDIWL